jgi:hypothetical protein
MGMPLVEVAEEGIEALPARQAAFGRPDIAQPRMALRE